RLCVSSAGTLDATLVPYTALSRSFHRQRKLAQHVDQLRLVGDADEPSGGSGDDFFPGQRAAAALDELQAAVGLVGTVHIDRDVADLVEVEHADAVIAQSTGGGFGAGYGPGDVALDAGQGIDEEVHGRAGADTDHFAPDHVIQRRQRGGLFLLFGCHLVPPCRRHDTASANWEEARL